MHFSVFEDVILSSIRIVGDISGFSLEVLFVAKRPATDGKAVNELAK